MQKKLLLITFVLASTVFSLMAQNTNDIFYIYRNDGNFNVFFREEVDSITCSNYDSDSIFHDEIVTQLVYTHDSIYRIPLDVIDSLSFYTPPTVYKPGVINLLDGLRDYIISAVEDTITIMAATPESLLPHLGDKIVTTEMSELFPIGYAGKVINIQKQPSGFTIMCCPVALEDVFEVFYGYTRTEVPVANSRKKAFVRQNSKTYQPEPFHRSLTYGLPNGVDVSLGNWAGTYNSRFDMTFAPKLWINGFIKIANDERYFSVSVTGDYSLREEFSQTGKLSWSHDFGLNIPIPIPVCPFLQIFVEPGLFVKAESESSCNLSFTQHFTSAFHYEWSSNGTIAMDPVFEIRRKEHTSNFKGAISGELACGGYLNIGIQAFKEKDKIASIYGRAELGLSVSGNVNMEYDEDDYTSNTRLYDMLKKSSCEANWYWGTSFEAQLTPFLHYSHGLPFGRQHNIWKHGFVPTFSNVSLKQCLSPQSSADASIDMSGDCLTPVEIGLSLRNSNNDEVADQYAQTAFESGNYRFRNTFNNLWFLNDDEEYTLYPKIRLFGIEMLASPSSGMERTEFPVKITDFTQTDSHYKKDAFTNDGMNYSYKYDCSVTIELMNSKDVDDWGYVYEYPNGKLAHISMKSMKSPYIDTRYSYFRNEMYSSICLYEYVKFKGNSEYYYADRKYYDVSYKDYPILSRLYTDFKVRKINNSTVEVFGWLGDDGNNSTFGGEPYEYGICYRECEESSDWFYVPPHISYKEDEESSDWIYLPTHNRNDKGKFSTTISNLKTEKKYIYCAYIQLKKDDYIYYDNSCSFAIPSYNPVVNISVNEIWSNDILLDVYLVDHEGTSYESIDLYISDNREMKNKTCIHSIYSFESGSSHYASDSLDDPYLKPSTTYYFQYTYWYSQDYGDVYEEINDVLEVTTLSHHFTVNSPSVWASDRNKWEFTGNVDFMIYDHRVYDWKGLYDYSDIMSGSVGFYYNTTGNPNASNANYVACNFSHWGNSSVQASTKIEMYFDTTYYFRGVYEKDGVLYFSNVSTIRKAKSDYK